MPSMHGCFSKLKALVLNLFISRLWGREEIFNRKIFFLKVMPFSGNQLVPVFFKKKEIKNIKFMTLKVLLFSTSAAKADSPESFSGLPLRL